MMGTDQSFHILVTGLRGLPYLEGGVEKVAELLYPRIAAHGVDVEIAVRRQFYQNGVPAEWRGIRLTGFWSPSHPGLEAFFHTFLVMVYALFSRPDLIHIHAVGPSIFTPLARVFRIPVVVTHHGPDYEREKWGVTARFILKMGERFGAVFANRVISISGAIQDILDQKYGRRGIRIPNGVERPEIQTEGGRILDDFGLTSERYVLQVSRFVPEKRQHDLIDAFQQATLSGWKLVLVGRLNSSDYTRRIVKVAESHPNVVLTGFQTGSQLSSLLHHAGIFVLPSSHEGLPVALLEALSHGIRCIASAIPANLEVEMPKSSYFPLGDVSVLAANLTRLSTAPYSAGERAAVIEWVLEKYNWDSVARQTLDVYRELLESSGGGRS